MIKKNEDSFKSQKDHNSELILKILNTTSADSQKGDEKEYYVDENWKISAKKSKNVISNDASKLKQILSESFPGKEIQITNNIDGSQTILIL